MPKTKAIDQRTIHPGFVADTPEGIEAMQLVTVKMGLRLESQGMKVRQGPKLRQPWAIKLGLKPNAKYDEVITAVEKRLEEIQANATGPLLKLLNPTKLGE